LKATRDGNHVRVYDAYLAKESIKEIDGRFYDPDDKAWVVPYTKENVALLGLLGAALDDSLAPMVETKDAGDEEPIFPMPIKATPYQHQVRAYNFALRTFGLGGAT
jgi:hypothetical protein